MQEKLPRWVWAFVAAILLLSSLPYLYALAIRPEGNIYLGVHGAFDDNAVYAAWMKQAQSGSPLFKNLFTTDEQPGLTVNLYFYAAGLASKVVGIPLAMHCFRLVFAALFLVSLYSLLRRVTNSRLAQASGLVVATLGAGVGWLPQYWANYGNAGPIDVWQPEAFTFPSIMMNGLFCAALWLIVVVWISILDCRESWRPVIPGALAALVLTNIHTYDMLTIGLVAVGFLVSQVVAKRATPMWVARSAVIACGALPAVIWFVYVRSLDPVFAARAETVTTSPPIRDVLLGYAPLAMFAILCVSILGARAGKRALGAASAILSAGVLIMIFALQQDYDASSLWLDNPGWLALFGACLIVCGMFRAETPGGALLACWLLVGLAALYYPGLFQRKLAMGLSVPMGALAGICIALVAERFANARLAKVVAVAFALVVSLTSFRWIQREVAMATNNISKTSVNAVFYPEDVAAIIRHLETVSGNPVVLAPPGISRPDGPDKWLLLFPDMNHIVSGWGGARTYAGHWSETPDYGNRRDELVDSVYGPASTPESIESLIRKTGAKYAVAIAGSEDKFPAHEKVVGGERLSLLRFY